MTPRIAQTVRAGHRLAAALAATALLAPAVEATTYVVGSDADLLAKSDAVVIATVVSIDTTAAGGAETVLDTRVIERLRGAVPDDVALYLPGGAVPARERVVFGTPILEVGSPYVLYLHRRGDGSWPPVDLALGVYAIEDGAGEFLVRRDLGASRVLSVRGGQLQRRGRRDVRRLRDLVAVVRGDARGGGATRELALPLRPRAASGPFTFMNLLPARWLESDSGEPITYVLDEENAATTGLDAVAAVDAALGAWSAVDCSAARLMRGGSTPPAPFNACDGVSQIVFGDPFGELGGAHGCSGVVGVGGYCTGGAAGEIDGEGFQRITEGDVVIADGLQGCPIWNDVNLAEMLTHEVGHTLGLGHSSEQRFESNPLLREATMYYRAHFDGRGATVLEDDRAGVCFAYPLPSRRDADADGVADDTDNCRDDANTSQADCDADGTGDACDAFTLRRLTMTGSVVRLSARLRLESGFDADRQAVEIRLVAGRNGGFRSLSPAGTFRRNTRGTFFRMRRRGTSEAWIQTLTLVDRGNGEYQLEFRARGMGYSGAAASVDRIHLTVGEESLSTPLDLVRDANGTFTFP